MTQEQKIYAVQNVKKTISITATALVFLVMMDLMILFTSMAQIAVEGKTGYWNPFWKAQARAVVILLARVDGIDLTNK